MSQRFDSGRPPLGTASHSTPAPSETTIISPSPRSSSRRASSNSSAGLCFIARVPEYRNRGPSVSPCSRGPVVVPRPQRQFVEHGPVVHDVDSRRIDAPCFEDGAEVFGDHDHRVAEPGARAVEPHEVLAGGVTNDGQLAFEQVVRGDAVDVLHPEHVADAVLAAVSDEPVLRNRRRVAGEDDFGLEVPASVRQQLAVGGFHTEAAPVARLGDHAAQIERTNVKALGIVGSLAQRSAGRVR